MGCTNLLSVQFFFFRQLSVQLKEQEACLKKKKKIVDDRFVLSRGPGPRFVPSRGGSFNARLTWFQPMRELWLQWRPRWVPNDATHGASPGYGTRSTWFLASVTQLHGTTGQCRGGKQAYVDWSSKIDFDISIYRPLIAAGEASADNCRSVTIVYSCFPLIHVRSCNPNLAADPSM